MAAKILVLLGLVAALASIGYEPAVMRTVAMVLFVAAAAAFLLARPAATPPPGEPARIVRRYAAFPDGAQEDEHPDPERVAARPMIEVEMGGARRSVAAAVWVYDAAKTSQKGLLTLHEGRAVRWEPEDA